MSEHRKYAIQRLHKDLKEICSLSPKEGIFARPLDDNIFEWHVNIVPVSGRYIGIVLHCILYFPDNYPKEPPKVKISTSIPHSNVVNYNGNKNYLCLDILNGFFCLDRSETHNSQSFLGWSSAYSVRSIIVQIQGFLLEDYIEGYDRSVRDTLYQLSPEQGGGNRSISNANVEYNKAFVEADKFRCHICGHHKSTPCPEINIPIPKRTYNRLRIPLYYIENEHMVLSHEFIPIVKKWYLEIMELINKFSKNNNICLIINNYFNDILGNNYNLLNCSNPDYIVDCDCPRCDNTRFWRGQYINILGTFPLQFINFTSLILKILGHSTQIPTHLQSYNKNTIWKLIKKTGYFENLKPMNEIENYHHSNTIQFVIEKNFKKNKIFKNLEYNLGKTNIYLNKIALSPYFMERLNTFCYYTRESFENTILGYAINITYFRGGIDIKEITTPLDLLSYNAFHICNIRRGMQNEKITYVLPLVINKANLKKAKGLMIYTINNICSHYDISIGKITSTYLTNQLTESHYNSVKTIKRKRLQYQKINNLQMDLTKEISKFKPKFALQIISKLLNSCIVKLVKGVSHQRNSHTSLHIYEKVLEGYCYFHRLLLQFTEWYPEIINIANIKLYNFIHNQKYRYKNETPNMTELFVYLAISNKYTWNCLKKVYLEEQGIRSVSWILKKYPKWSFPRGELDIFNSDRIYESFQATIIDKKITVFNVYFLNMTKKSSIEKYDKFYGKADRILVKKFQKDIPEIERTLFDWKTYYQYVNISKKYVNKLANNLRYNVILSEQRRYHNLEKLGINTSHKIPVMYGEKGWKIPIKNNFWKKPKYHGNKKFWR